MSWGLLPAPARPTAPSPSIFPSPWVLSLSQHLCLLHPGKRERLHLISQLTRVYSQRTAPESQAGSRATGLEGQARGSRLSSWWKQTFLPYKALFGPEQLDGGQWSRRAVEVGGTSGWHRRLARARVPGLKLVGSEGVGLGKGVQSCGWGWGRSRLRKGVCSV